MTACLADDRFTDVLGPRRANSQRSAADGDWRTVLDAARRIPRGQDRDLLAAALIADLHAGFRHSALYTLRQLGVSGTRARQVCAYRRAVLHLLPEPPAGERAPHHPVALCGRRLLREHVTEPNRGAWNFSPDTGYRRCKGCAKHADLVPETRDPAVMADLTPFLPADQDRFEANLRARCRDWAQSALDDRSVSADALGASAEAGYTRLLGEHAVALILADPRRARRAAFGDHDLEARQMLADLRATSGYVGTLDDLLVDVDWEALVAARLPTSRRDASCTTVAAWQQHRDAFDAQLRAIAAGRAAASVLHAAQERLRAAEDELAAARVDLDAARTFAAIAR